MLKNQPIIYSLLILIAILLFRCAAQQSPSGGKKDTIPPKLLFSYPKNKSVDVKAQFIQLEFDEYIQIEPAIHQQLLITPNIETWGHKATKKGIRIQFDKPLKPNTTYTFNFRQSIADLNEKNPAQNLKLVFSTSHYIDSLSIYGEVREILTNKPVENALVSLYISADTSIVTKHKPFYFTKTNKEGKYELENLKEGIYKIYAFNDNNNNLTYQNETESIGFLESDLNLNQSIKNLNFGITKVDQTPPKISFKTQNEKYYDIEFNKGVTDIEITTKADILYKPLDTKIVRLYNLSNELDSIPINLKATDSSGNVLNKDLKIKFGESKPEEVKKGKNKSQEKRQINNLETKVEPGNSGKISPELLITISFSKPIKNVDIDKIQLLGDTINRLPIIEGDWKWNKYKTEWILKKYIKVNKKVRLLIPKGTFMSIENDSSSKIKNDYDLKIAEDYGSIGGSINIKDFKNYIIQLVNKDNKVLAEQYDVIQYKFDFLEAGDYQLRIVIDKNKNKKWDIGDVNKSIKSEEIIYIDKVINLKQNWDIEENIIL